MYKIDFDTVGEEKFARVILMIEEQFFVGISTSAYIIYVGTVLTDQNNFSTS